MRTRKLIATSNSVDQVDINTKFLTRLLRNTRRIVKLRIRTQSNNIIYFQITPQPEILYTALGHIRKKQKSILYLLKPILPRQTVYTQIIPTILK